MKQLTLPAFNWCRERNCCTSHSQNLGRLFKSSCFNHSIRLFPSVSEKMGESDSEEVSCSAWTNKQSKVVQPDLNFIGGYIC